MDNIMLSSTAFVPASPDGIISINGKPIGLLEIKCMRKCFYDHPHYNAIMEFHYYMKSKGVIHHAYIGVVNYPYISLPDSAFKSIDGLINASYDIYEKYMKDLPEMG